jgi:MFS family permease
VSAGTLRFRDTFASLEKHRNYRLYFIGQVVSMFGNWMQDTALPWLVLEQTHSPVAVGFLVFCRYLPVMTFGLFSGAVADRFDYRRLVIWTQIASMLVATALAVLTLAGTPPLWAVYLLAVIGGCIFVLDAPTRNVLTYQLVGPEELPNAVALNASIFNVARIFGPATAGILIAAVGVGICFALNALSYLAVLVVLMLIRPSELHPRDRSEHVPGAVAAAREGLAYAWREPRVRVVMLVTLCVCLLGFNFRVLVPVLAAVTLDGDARTLGFLFAALGVGALTGSIVSAAASRPTLTRVFAGAFGSGVAMLVLAPIDRAWAAAAVLCLVGLTFSIWTAAAQTIVQLVVPDHLRGRIASLHFFALTGLTPIGSLITGYLAEIGGTELAYAVAGTVSVVVSVGAAVWYSRTRPVRAPAAAAEPPRA